MKKIIFGFVSLLTLAIITGCASSNDGISYEDEPREITK